MSVLIVLAGWLFAPAAYADDPAAGKLLVATAEIRGPVFARTVILLLNYSDSGAMGIVVNRPTEIAPAELTDDEAFDDYRGTLYWGGPVEMASVRALRRSDAPIDDAMMIVDNVYVVPVDAALASGPADAAALRLYIGYAGWAPGQLDEELTEGSWLVVAATDELVFADDPRKLWEQLTPVQEYRAAVDQLPLR